MSLSNIKDLVTIFSAQVAAGSLMFAALNLRLTHRTNRAKFWLELRAAFAKHEDVHRKARPGGDWSNNAGPASPEVYAQVESKWAYSSTARSCSRKNSSTKRPFVRSTGIASRISC